MADQEYDIYTDSENDSKLVKDLRAQLKEKADLLKELENQVNTLKAGERKRTLSETLQARGLNPKIAAFVPNDIEGDAIDEWLSEYGDVFGVQVGEAPASQKQAIIARDSEQAAELRRIAAAESGGQQPDVQGVLSNIENAESLDDLMAALKQL